MKKVLIGMSGGVDSSVAAYLLKKDGYDVTGITLKMWNQSENMPEASDQSIKDASQVAKKIGINHIVVNCAQDFSKHVVDYFSNEYINGRTPNPCIECNKHIKFGFMLDYAKNNGYDYIATGHYARIEKNGENDRYYLKKSDCTSKDQTYFLYTLSQEQLRNTVMPLGTYTKEEIRKIAAENLGMYISEKADSMEICFVPHDDYISFIKKNKNYIPQKGNFIDKFGNILGTHDGIVNFTIGQRKGLGIALGKPVFVTNIDPVTSNVTLGEKGEEYSSGLIADNVVFSAIDYPEVPFKTTCKIRYSATPVPCHVTPIDANSVKVTFDTPQRAVTPGQSVVFYEEDILLGGGIIKKTEI